MAASTERLFASLRPLGCRAERRLHRSRTQCTQKTGRQQPLDGPRGVVDRLVQVAHERVREQSVAEQTHFAHEREHVEQRALLEQVVDQHAVQVFRMCRCVVMGGSRLRSSSMFT